MSQGTTTTATAMKPASVVRAYLAISGLFTLSASVIWGVNTLFLLDAGLDIFEVFIANAAFTAGKAGKKGPCAAQGLPQVALVDATARQPTAVP